VHQQSGDDQRKSEKVDHSPAVIHFSEAAIRMLHLRREKNVSISQAVSIE